MDGIIFSKDHAAIITGELTDDLPKTTHVQCFSDIKDPWYYLHVKDGTCSTTAPVTEYIPIAEYLFRYDRGAFWVGRSTFEYFRFPFNRFTRWWLDGFVYTRTPYKALRELHAQKLHCSRPRTSLLLQLKNSLTTQPSLSVYSCSDYVHCAEVPCLLSILTFPKKRLTARSSRCLASVSRAGACTARGLSMKNRGLERKLRELGEVK